MKRIDFNAGWSEYPAGKPESRKNVRLPHDAMLEERRQADLIEGAATGYFPGGTYIYEKDFDAPLDWAGKSVLLEAGGIYQKSTVTLNGQKIGGWVYGYTGFVTDLTKALRIGHNNHLTILADNSQTPNSRWYTGSGIYRPLYILIGGNCHAAYDGIRIETLYTDCSVEAVIDGETVPMRGSAELRCRVALEGHEALPSGTILHYAVLDSAGNNVTAGTAPITGETVVFDISLSEVSLWSELCPSLYTLRIRLPEDESIVRFGIRSLQWNANEGLTVNGRSVKLRGACVHHDNGILGAKEYREAACRKIRILKEQGYNAIRSAHNPLSREMLDTCDELGMYVMDEAFDMWLTAKNRYDYSIWFDREWKKDLSAMIAKDYNHPSVIIYSVGNEISDVGKTYAEAIQREMLDYVHSIDSTRPVTNSINIMAAMAKPKKSKRPRTKKRAEDTVDPRRKNSFGSMVGSKLINNIVTFFPKLIASVTADRASEHLNAYLQSEDIIGFNYGHLIMGGLAALNPDKLILNTETFPKSIAHSWPIIEKNPQLIGDFLWTGWDYLGEAGIGVCTYGKNKKQFNKPYPCISAGIGSVNLIGNPEAQAYFSKAAFHLLTKPYIGVRPLDHADERVEMGQWRGTDVVSSWTWKGCEGKAAEIHIFANADSVELFQDGRSLGRKPVCENLTVFETTYVPGILCAIAYDDSGKELGRSELKTANAVANVSIEIEPHTPEDSILFVSLSLVDEEGNLNRNEDRRIRVRVNGGELLALGSGAPLTQESYLSDTFTSYQGKLLAVVRPEKSWQDIQISASII